MAHPILDGIRLLRGRLVRRAWAAGGLRVFAAVITVVSLFGAVDYLLRIVDPGVRLMVSAAVVGVFAAATWRWIVRPLRNVPDEVILARHVMEHDNRFGEELPSAVEFLRQSEDDYLAGSRSLRRAVVIRATTESEGLAWKRLADSVPGDRIRRAALVAMMPALLLAVAAIWRPNLIGVVLARLAAPLGSTEWPRAHDLYFVKPPQRLASGEAFEVELADRRGDLPDVVWIYYRYLRDGQEVVQREAMQRYGDLMVARREIVTQPFAYRAAGGDDDRMDWRRLEVVEPPRLRSLELTLHPPAYSGLPEVSSDRHVRALPGTQIELSARVAEPIVRAGLIDEYGRAVAASVSDDGQGIHVPPGLWTVEETARWTLDLEDAEGLVGGQDERISVHVSPDPPPSVVLERPAIDQYVTPQAIVPISVTVKDNLAIRDITLAYLRSDQSDQDRQRIELYHGPDEPPILLPNTSREDAQSLGAIEADRRNVEYAWDLAPLSLSPGVFFSVHAEATDYRGELGQTPLPRNIYIVSLEELEARLVEQQDVLLGELERALQLERDARAELGGVQVQLARVGGLDQREIDALQAVEINQRHITDLLADRDEGIPSRIQTLREDLAANRIENPDIRRRLDELDAELDRLATEHLPAIGHELTTALKTAVLAAARTDRLDASLTSAAGNQDAVIESLAALLGDFSRWSDYRRFARDVAQLRADQQRITQITREGIGLDQLQADPNQLTPQARADREKAAARQLELARRVEVMQQQMQLAVSELAEADPLAATTLADAVDAARRHAIDRRMREAAAYVGRNQVGRSLDAQAQVDEALREVLAILRNTRDGELRRLVSKLREAEADLAALRDDVTGLRTKVEAAEGADPRSNDTPRRELERLLRVQHDLQESVQRMSRRLMRLTADDAARSAARAAGRLGRGGQGGSGGGEGPSAGDRLQAAERDLEQAQAELAEARRQAEADLASEQLADTLTTLESLLTRQQRVVEESQRLDQARAAQREWTFGQLQSLVSLAEEEKLLRDETQAAAEKIVGLAVVQTALQIAADDMRDAADGLAQRNTGRKTQASAQAARVRLQMVLTALGNDARSTGDRPGDQQDAGGGAGGDGQGGQGGDAEDTIELAELRLLKLMQSDLRERTAAAEAARAAGGGQTANAEAEFARLAEEQGKIAALVQQLLDAAVQAQNEAEVDLPSLDDALQQEDPLPESDF